MAIEEPKPESAEGEEKMVTAEFYKDLFEKIASKESQVIQNINLTKERDREISKD